MNHLSFKVKLLIFVQLVLLIFFSFINNIKCNESIMDTPSEAAAKYRKYYTKINCDGTCVEDINYPVDKSQVEALGKKDENMNLCQLTLEEYINKNQSSKINNNVQSHNNFNYDSDCNKYIASESSSTEGYSTEDEYFNGKGISEHTYHYKTSDLAYEEDDDIFLANESGSTEGYSSEESESMYFEVKEVHKKEYSSIVNKYKNNRKYKEDNTMRLMIQYLDERLINFELESNINPSDSDFAFKYSLLKSIECLNELRYLQSQVNQPK